MHQAGERILFAFMNSIATKRTGKGKGAENMHRVTIGAAIEVANT